MREAIDVGVVQAILQAQRMLEIWMADFAGMRRRPGRAPTCRRSRSASGRACSAIARHQEHVAVLQVGMSQIAVAQPSRQLCPHLHQGVQVLRLVGVVADELVEREAFDPFHLQEREPLAANADAFSKYLKPTVKGSLALARCSSIWA